MKSGIIGILAIFTLMTHAQGFCMRWLACPDTDSASAVWFRHTYLGKSRPLQGNIAVVTTGRYLLYINESNVTPGYVVSKDTIPVTTIINVSGYLRNDSNTIAILYIPCSHRSLRSQIAVCYYGREHNGAPFAYLSDSDWLCRSANIAIGDNGEYHDFHQLVDGGYTNEFVVSGWKRATATDKVEPLWSHGPGREEGWMNAVHIRRPHYFDLVGERAEFEFGLGFYGYVRITLRGAQRGECIMVNDNRYICSGQMDEQLITRFVPAYYRRISISGDARFDVSQVCNVEGIAIAVDSQYNFYNP